MSAEVCVEAPARLHLGFYDLSCARGRRFGSLGLTLDGINTTVRVATTPAESSPRVTGAEPERARRILDRLRERLGEFSCGDVVIGPAIPPHAGLGSGTQLALALATAIAQLNGIERSARELAALCGRGARSGIGIAAFEAGGFIVDSGRGPATEIPTAIAQLPFPERWRVLLVLDRAWRGLSGREEQRAFAELAPMARSTGQELSHLTLTAILPALAEEDFPSFSAALGIVQRRGGEYFASQQGGAFTSPRVASIIESLSAVYNLDGWGQSSWGPTGFIFISSPELANEVLRDALRRFPAQQGIEFRLCKARNKGAVAHASAASPCATTFASRRRAR